MTHPVMWFEVLGADGDKLRKFYGDLFGWTFDVNPPGGYGVARTGDDRGIMGGVGPVYPGTKSWVTFYTETPDVTASLAKAKARAQRIQCTSQMRQLGTGFHLFTMDHNDQLPPAAYRTGDYQYQLSWDDYIHRYIGGADSDDDLLLGESGAITGPGFVPKISPLFSLTKQKAP